MRLKSYFAATVEAAMHQARVELGDDAMLLDSRPAPQQARHLGAYEVVFSLPEAILGEVTTPARPVAVKENPRYASDLAELRRELDRMRNSVERSSSLAWAISWLGRER